MCQDTEQLQYLIETKIIQSSGFILVSTKVESLLFVTKCDSREHQWSSLLLKKIQQNLEILNI